MTAPPGALRHWGLGPVAGLAVLTVAVLLDAALGQAGIGLRDVIEALIAPDPEDVGHVVIRHMRLPRVAAGLLAGAALGVAGVLLQAVTRNRLASPGLLGVNAGAYLALTVSLLFPAALQLPPIAAAFAGGVAATALVWAIAGGLGDPLRLTLAGVAVTMALGACASAVVLFHEESLTGLYIWGAGALDQIGWDSVAYAAPHAAFAGGVSLLLARPLDLLALGEDTARALGQRAGATALGAVAAATVLAAAAVCVAGPVAFVGLAASNLLRLAGVRRHALLLPGAALWGGALLVLADVAAQALSLRNFPVPAGVVAAAIGAPVLVALIARQGRRGLTALVEPARIAFAAPSRRLPLGGLVGGLGVAGAALVLLAVTLGEAVYTPRQLWDLLGGGADATMRTFVVDLRLPRVITALICGALLAVAGLMLQGIIRNPLAAPEVLGVSQGAGLAALALLLAVPSAPLAAVQGSAFAGGFAVFLLVIALARRSGLEPTRLALTGIAIAACCAAVSSMLVIGAGLQGGQALIWLAGTVYGRGWDQVVAVLPWAALLLPVAWMAGRGLDVMALGEQAAAALGLSPQGMRQAVLALAVAMAAAAVATVGAVAFIGLVAPHAARLLLGPRHRNLVIAAALIGAVLLAGADVVGRLVLAPREIPAGLVTALLGAPYFLLLLWRARRSA